MEPQPAVSVRSVNFVQTFPWLRIGQAVSCALAPQQVAIGVLAAFLMAPFQAVEIAGSASRPSVSLLLSGDATWNWWEDTYRPVDDVWTPFWLMGSLPTVPWMWLMVILFEYAVWTVGGVAVARCAAVQFCRDENPSLRGSLEWSLNRAVSSLTAIVTPLGGAAALLLVAAVMAIPAGVPGLGAVWMQVAAPLQFVLGVVAGFILLLLPVLWPLMVAAVAVDNSDAFDAFSRSFSLVTSRLWSTLALVLLTGASAVVLTLAFQLLLDAGTVAVVWVAAWTTTEETTISLAGVLVWWREVVYRGLCGSLFWTHATIVYLFLREQVDAVPVFSLSGYSDDHRPHELYPVVGMPAAAPQTPTDPPLKVTTDETGPDSGAAG